MKNQSNWGLPEPKISKSKSKNGKYVAEFYYWKAEGVKGHTNTKSFTTEKRALKMAKAIQEESANQKRENITKQSEETISQAMDDFANYLDKKLQIKTTTKTSGMKDDKDNIKSLKKNHTPIDLLNKKMYDLEDDDFRFWIKHIDQKDMDNTIYGLSSSRVQSYRRTLKAFIRYLSKNEYFVFDKKLGDHLEREMFGYEIKDKEVGKREDVYVPSLLDMNIFCSGYKRDNFKSEYCYVVFKIMFYSGMRISEVIPLRWKNIDFNSGLIYIRNSVNQKENRSNAMMRLNSINPESTDETKNNKSRRCIPMMEVYYKLFKNYKYNYQKHFKLTDEQMETAFCFPKIQSKRKNGEDQGPFVYQNTRWFRDEIENECEITGIPYFPAESLRHGCAYFLCNTLHILEGEAYDLFGHTDNDMLKNVYANLKAEETAKRIAKRQKGLFYQDPEYEKKLLELQEKAKEEFTKGDKLNNKLFQEQFFATKEKIMHLIDSGVHYYTYTDDEEDVIIRLTRQFHFNDEIAFIKEEK